jgi:hypothetical protein
MGSKCRIVWLVACLKDKSEVEISDAARKCQDFDLQQEAKRQSRIEAPLAACSCFRYNNSIKILFAK